MGGQDSFEFDHAAKLTKHARGQGFVPLRFSDEEVLCTKIAPAKGRALLPASQAKRGAPGCSCETWRTCAVNDGSGRRLLLRGPCCFMAWAMVLDSTGELIGPVIEGRSDHQGRKVRLRQVPGGPLLLEGHEGVYVLSNNEGEPPVLVYPDDLLDLTEGTDCSCAAAQCE